MLDDYYGQLTNTIAEERKFTKPQFDSMVNQGYFLAKEAKEQKLIDKYCYEDELDSIIKLNNKNFKKITAKQYG
jgi:ClpP class serine protease